MNALTFTLITQPKFTLDVSPLIPDNLEGKNITHIKNIKLRYGKEIVKLEKLFLIKGKNFNHVCIDWNYIDNSNWGCCHACCHISSKFIVVPLYVRFLSNITEGSYFSSSIYSVWRYSSSWILVNWHFKACL